MTSDPQTGRTFVLDVVNGQTQLFAFDAFANRPHLTAIALPAGFTLAEAGGPTAAYRQRVVWVEGAVEIDDYPVVLEVDAAGTRVERSLVLSAVDDESFAFTGRDEALLTTRRHRLPHHPVASRALPRRGRGRGTRPARAPLAAT